MARIYKSAEELIGSTPLLELTGTEKEIGNGVKLYAKRESKNPAGSAKDRVGYEMIADAERRGLLKEGSVIIEPTSGNTGIGLASVAAVRGYRCIIVMPDNMSAERRALMRAFGAELVLTDGSKGMSGAIEQAERLAREIPNSFIPGQFENPANAAAHFKTTGPEIFEDTDGEVDIFVAGVGTGGTITGVGKYLKSKKATAEIVGVEPASSPFLTEGRGGPHKIQGIGAGFEPKVLDRTVVDRIIPVADEDAILTARDFGKKEGILIGISSGAAVFAAMFEAKKPENAGKTIVVLLPDSGDRYISSGLYD